MSSIKVTERSPDGEVTTKVIKKQKVYIAGPMRFFPEFNFPAFMKAQAYLESEGYEVFNPAEKDLERGFDPTGMDGSEDVELLNPEFGIRRVMKDDLDYITEHADLVVMLDGWRQSRGAVAEFATARACGIPVQNLDGSVIHDKLLVVPQ